MSRLGFTVLTYLPYRLSNQLRALGIAAHWKQTLAKHLGMGVLMMERLPHAHRERPDPLPEVCLETLARSRLLPITMDARMIGHSPCYWCAATAIRSAS